MEHYSTQEYVARNSAFLVILGGMLAALGLITALSPLAAGIPMKLVLGVMLLSRASMQIYYGIKVRHWGHLIGAYMGLGSIVMSFVSVSCAVIIIATSWWQWELVNTVIACYLVLLGGADMLHALELKTADGWFFMFLNGMAGVMLGAMVWQQWPLAGLFALGGMMGLSMILGGLSLALLGAAGRSHLIDGGEPGPGLERFDAGAASS